MVEDKREKLASRIIVEINNHREKEAAERWPSAAARAQHPT